jgi:Sporulation related domain.
MSDAQVAGGFDRLPWLADETKAPARRRMSRNLPGWAAASVLLVAGASFWLGLRPTQQTRSGSAVVGRTTTLAVPKLHPATQPEVRIARQPEIRSARIPEVRQPAEREVRIAPPPPRKIEPAEVVTPAARKIEAPRQAAVRPPAAKAVAPTALTPWPSRVVAGASGRLVQIGAYGSRIQAKRGWLSMVRAYPAVAHLSAVVVETRNSRGRHFYRFQIGTTSQAHSEVLCQRMEKIRLSCAVVGLPWKARVER